MNGGRPPQVVSLSLQKTNMAGCNSVWGSVNTAREWQDIGTNHNMIVFFFFPLSDTTIGQGWKSVSRHVKKHGCTHPHTNTVNTDTQFKTWCLSEILLKIHMANILLYITYTTVYIHTSTQSQSFTKPTGLRIKPKPADINISIRISFTQTQTMIWFGGGTHFFLTAEVVFTNQS